MRLSIYGSRVFRSLATLSLAFFTMGTVFAESYPVRPIRIIVPCAPGAGVTDIMARILSKNLSEVLGQSVIIDNRPGGGGIVGADAAARSVADGYTLLMTNITFAVNPFLHAKLPFNAQEDFVPVTLVNTAPLLLVVNPSVPANTVQELVDYLKARPRGYDFGSGGVGSTPHLTSELFLSSVGADAVHIPYKGASPSLADLVAGRTTFMFENVPGTMPFVKSGKLRALAITSKQRSPQLGDMPTMIESGVPDFEVLGWNALFAPKGTPSHIVDRLQTEISKFLSSPPLQKQFADLGADPVGGSPAELGDFVKAEMSRWEKIIKEKGIRSE